MAARRLRISSTEFPRVQIDEKGIFGYELNQAKSVPANRPRCLFPPRVVGVSTFFRVMPLRMSFKRSDKGAAVSGTGRCKVDGSDDSTSSKVEEGLKRGNQTIST